MQDPVPESSPSLVRRLMIIFMIVITGCLLFFGGKFIYNLGQSAALKISGLDLTPYATIPPALHVTATVTSTSTASAADIWFFAPTPTQTKIPWTSCPGIVITASDISDGDFLHVLRCEDGLEYEIGPLTRGVYAVSPDDKYMVYCSLNGIIYAARIGSPTLTVIKKAQREFFVFSKNVDPSFELTFSGEGPYVLEVNEKRYGQNMPINMPRWLSE